MTAGSGPDRTVLVCTGRPVRRFDNRPGGEPCGAVYRLTAAHTVESARVAGWCVGPAGRDGTRPAMCPDCRRPAAGDTPSSTEPHLEPLPGL